MARAKATSYDTLIEKKRKFVDAFLKTGKYGDAYDMAGYRPSPKSRMANARRLWIEMKPFIAERLDQCIGGRVPLALKIIEEIMMDENQPAAVRLKCAQDCLSRAGLDAAKKIEFEDKTPDKLTEAEIEHELHTLLKKRGCGEEFRQRIING